MLRGRSPADSGSWFPATRRRVAGGSTSSGPPAASSKRGGALGQGGQTVGFSGRSKAGEMGPKAVGQEALLDQRGGKGRWRQRQAKVPQQGKVFLLPHRLAVRSPTRKRPRHPAEPGALGPIGAQ